MTHFLRSLSLTLAAGRWGVLGGRASLLPLIAAWVLLRPLAAASPPDPTWIAGLYDDGDFDNVVMLIGSLVGVSDSPGPAPTGPDWHVASLVPSGRSAPVSSSLLTLLDRSPPQP